MGYASISGKAITNPNAPRAFGVCDRCGQWRNHADLRWQFDYRGRNLANIRILVCEICEDDPQPQLKPRIIPPDPVPIANARVEPFISDEEDHSTSTNPALPNVDWGVTTNILLSGLQFIDGSQLQGGELVLVMGQTDSSKNGIYKVNTGVWALQGFDNDTHRYINAAEIDTSWSGGVLTYGQLGIYLGAVNVARGTYAAKLFQIYFENPGVPLSVGTRVTIGPVAAFAVNHFDFFTGIYMAGGETMVTQDGDIRTTQQTGAAEGSLNEIPGYSNIVPGACGIGEFDEVPYGNASKRGLPSGFDSLPFAGPLWPTLQNQSVNYWYNVNLQPFQWIDANNIEATWYPNNWWPNPGPGAAWNPIALLDTSNAWVNNVNIIDFWANNLNQTVDWANIVDMTVFRPGGEVLFTNDKCELVLWHNTESLGQALPAPLITGIAPFNVNFGQIYSNQIPPEGLI